MPREKEATALIQLMEELTEYLLMVPNTLHFSGVEFGEMFYQQELDSFCCDGSAEAVSYTHLDVYKRQRQNKSGMELKFYSRIDAMLRLAELCTAEPEDFYATVPQGEVWSEQGDAE